MTLRRKLLLPLFLCAALMLAYLDAVWLPRSLEAARQEHVLRVTRHVDSVVESLIPLLSSGQIDAIHDNLDALKARNRDWRDIVLADARRRQVYPLLTAPAAAPPRPGIDEVVKRRIAFLDKPLGELEVRVDLSDLLENERLKHRGLALLFSAIVLIFLVMPWALLEYGVRRPVARLAVAALELSRRNFDVALPKRSGDEVGALVDTFSTMRDDLRRYHLDLERELDERARREATLAALNEELAQHRGHLEELVAERTAALEERNASLSEALDLVKHTQNELVASEKMASLGRLVAGFAHEINTPIGIAVGATSHALEASRRIAPLLSQDEVDETVLRAHLSEIDEACRLAYGNLARAADLVSRFKRTSVDQTRGMARLYDLRETLTDIVASLHDVLKRTPVTVAIDCPPGINLYGYPGALGQIVTNLVVNAVHHAFAGGSRRGEIRIAAAQVDGEIAVEVRDNGCGMDEATAARLFEPFFTTARDTGGTGLGLFICHNLATSELKGSIRCDSTLGEGTRFLLRYPAAAGEALPA